MSTQWSGRSRRQPVASTPVRTLRIPDDEWQAAQAAALARGETVTDAVRRYLRGYAKRNA